MNEEFMITTQKEEAGSRLDTFLSGKCVEKTRSFFQKLIQDGLVLVNGKAESKNYRLKENDRILISVPEPEPVDVLPENIPLAIVYEDKDLMVVNKPQGMVVHPAPGNLRGTLVNAVMYHCGEELSSINGTIRPGIVHRIDKDTSGLLVIAKTDQAHHGLSEQFQKHSIHRVYHAVVWNHFREPEGIIDRFVGRDPKNRLRMAVVPEGKGRRAITHYHVLRQESGFAYIECRLETGRTHQIRVHMASVQHPLLGDPVYGPKKKTLNIQGQVLHAKELGFLHPVTGKKLMFDSPLPEAFQRAMIKVGLRVNGEENLE